MTFRTIEQLTSVIGRTATTLSKRLADCGLNSPTIEDKDGASFKEIDPLATKELVDAARELEHLVQGPGQALSLLGFAVRLYHHPLRVCC